MFQDTREEKYCKPYADEVLNAVISWTSDHKEQNELLKDVCCYMEVMLQRYQEHCDEDL